MTVRIVGVARDKRRGRAKCQRALLLVNRSQKTQHALPFLESFRYFIHIFADCAAASAASAASAAASSAAAAALYLSAAVLVGEIVCNHENLISAQIC